MGYWKERQIEVQQQGYNNPPDKYVCAKHFLDTPLKEFAEKNAERGHCNYCTRPYMHTNVISLKKMVAHMHEVISIYYDNPDNVGVPYAKSWIDDDDDESRLHDQSGYVAIKNRDIYNADQLFEGLFDVDNEELYRDIVHCFNQHLWVSKKYFSFSTWEELDFDWKEFCRKVKSSKKYSYFQLPPLTKDYESENGLDHILPELGYIVKEHKLIKVLSVGTCYYRVRNHDKSKKAANFKELAAPPSQFVKYPNRMSPEGVSMFYGSENLRLCLREAQVDKEASKDDLMTSFGRFELTQEINVIDFTELPQQPNFWSGEDNQTLAFLYSFSKEISRPIENEKIEEYIPTQVMTGFFQHSFYDRYGIKIDGLIYHSAKEKGSKCCVLFFDDKTCPDYLTLVKCETKPYSEREKLIE